jgi:hypothetical protein
MARKGLCEAPQRGARSSGRKQLSAVASPAWKPTIGANFGFNLRSREENV